MAASVARPKGGIGRMLLVGDCMLGRMVDQALSTLKCTEEGNSRAPDRLASLLPELTAASPGSAGQGASKGGASWVWGDTLPLFHSADLRLVNLETAITRHTHKWQGQAFNFKMDPANVDVLTDAKVDFCSLANNHILDFQEQGMWDTMQTLRHAGIQYAGCGEDIEEASKPAVLQLDGTPVLCFSACDHYSYWAALETRPGVFFLDPNRYLGDDIALLSRQVQQAREKHGVHSLVIMCMHWGPNFRWSPSEAIRCLAHDLVDKCGVDVIVGTSAHHVQGVEVYRGKPILYGLGDFVDDYAVNHEFRNDLGFAYMLHWDGNARQCTSIHLHPTRIRGLRCTRLLHGADREWLVSKMVQLCAEVGTTCKQEDGEVTIALTK